MNLIPFRKKTSTSTRVADSFVIYTNDIVNLTYMPSKSCYASKLSEDFDAKLRYIKARIGEAHESVIEHTNVCILITASASYAIEYAQIANGFRYLNVEPIIDDGSLYLLIGGSIRGYKHLIRETLYQANPILAMIKRRLYECCYREFFVDLIEMGVMEERFIVPGVTSSTVYDLERDDLTTEEAIELQKKINSQNYCNSLPSNRNDLIDILNIDSVRTIYNRVKAYGFSMEQCLSMASVTILFKDMSRIITQQLDRHRNAITQESQRYVDYSGAKFNSPIQFKPDKYEQDKVYVVNTLNFHGTAQEIGEEMCDIYKELKEQGMANEDARGYLPANVQSSKVFMTFTYRSLLSFLHLRTESHAQAEIRLYADSIFEAFSEYLSNNVPEFDDDIYYYLIPRCMKTESDEYAIEVDEPIDEETVEVVMDEESYADFDQDENIKMFKEEIKGTAFDPSRYAYTRESDKLVKEAASGKKDV